MTQRLAVLNTNGSLVFHDSVISTYVPISAYSGLLKFDMKVLVNVARVVIGQFLLKALGGDIRVVWTHF